MTTKSVRAHETRIEIDAPIEEVWKALTDATEIARWFAPKMTVEPGVGGFVIADWGPGIEWKTAIEVWEPNKHLRLVETRDRALSPDPNVEQLEPCRLLQDFYLEGQGGKTVLRLVHSGFGSSKGWDHEYEGTQGGWKACFLRLKTGLERHRHSSVHNIMVTTLREGMTHNQVIEKVEAAAPERFDVAIRHDYQVCGYLPEHNGSIVSISSQPSPTGSIAYVEFTLYALTDAQAREVEAMWRNAVNRALK
jgi:uncharacterized protein YndB with AHSA1/START domain